MGHVVIACTEYIAQIFELHARRAGMRFVTCQSLAELKEELHGWPVAVIVGECAWLKELHESEDKKWPVIDATCSGMDLGYQILEPSCDFLEFWSAMDASGQCWAQARSSG
eukprot:symbB.v1.2.005303.t1/scaffold283.1/size308953/4